MLLSTEKKAPRRSMKFCKVLPNAKQIFMRVKGHFLHSRIPSVENGPFRLDFFRLDSYGSSYRTSRRFYSFCALPRGGWCEGVLLYGSRKSAGSSVLRAFLASNACSRSTNLRPSGLVALGLAESRQSYVRGVALSREPAKLQQA